MLSCKELRRNGWDSLSGRWGGGIGTVLLAGIITGVCSLILGGPIALGLATYFTNLQRQNNANVNNLFDGFKNFGNSFVAYLLQGIFITLWSILLIIPGLVKTFSYSMTFYIMNDRPEYSATQAITKSREMMNGYKGKLFLLNLSFIGWYLLSVITCGIALFWVGPYVQAATAAFYEELKVQNGEVAAPQAETAA